MITLISLNTFRKMKIEKEEYGDKNVIDDP